MSVERIFSNLGLCREVICQIAICCFLVKTLNTMHLLKGHSFTWANSLQESESSDAWLGVFIPDSHMSFYNYFDPGTAVSWLPLVDSACHKCHTLSGCLKWLVVFLLLGRENSRDECSDQSSRISWVIAFNH